MTVKRILIFASLIISSLSTKAQDDYLIRNVSLISMEKDTIISDCDILISNRTIKQIGKGLQVSNSKVTIIDGTNKFIIPGLADMHLHLWGDSTALELYVANGVTSIKSMSGKPAYLKWKEQIQSGKKLGPQLYVSGPLMNDISFMDRFVPLPAKFIFFWFHIILFSVIVYIIFRIAIRKRIKNHSKRLLIELSLPLIISIVVFCIEYRFVPLSR